MSSSSASSARLQRTALVVCWCAVSLVGCRNNASQRDAYIRDLRMHEDQIYELQDYMTEYQFLLREQRKENARLRKQLAEQSSDDTVIEVEVDEESLLDIPTDREENGDTILPNIDLGEPVPSEELEQIPAGDAGRRRGGSRTQLTSATATASDNGAQSAVFEPPPRPTELATSCAMYAEQMPLEPNTEEGPAIGLMAIVEPLTTDGSAGYFTGELSLMLVDPLAPDDEWEISRWDYTPEEVELAWRDHARRVLDLPLAVPSSAPLGRPLELWVRLISSEGDRKILCSTAVTLADPVGMVGVPVSGGASSTDPAITASSGWTAAEGFYGKPTKQPADEPATWQAATTLPPPAIARAEAEEGQPRQRVAERAPEWSPFR